MQNTYLEVLDQKQKDFLPSVRQFKDYYLAGGTALALQIGHRKSIDFDLFTREPIKYSSIVKKVKELNPERNIIDSKEQLTYVIKGVNITFLEYPFDVEYSFNSELGLNLPSPLSIGAMKAYALGRRAKWKDYVDIYFLLKLYGIEKLVLESNKIFGTLFNEKNFRAQLSFFEDVDYSEEVEYLDIGPSIEEVKEGLQLFSV